MGSANYSDWQGLDGRPQARDNRRDFADVAELADAQASGACGLTPV